MINIQQHMQLTQQQRQAHTNTNTKCFGYVLKSGPNKGQLSDHGRYPKHSLLDFHQIEDFKSRQINTCHLCPNHSQAPNGFVCVNPRHLYFGSAKENQNDKPQDVRKASASVAGKVGGKIGGKKSGPKNSKKLLKEGRHNMQQHHTCPHCSFEGKGTAMKRWHFDSCKYRKNNDS